MRKAFLVLPLLAMVSMLLSPAAEAKTSSKGLNKFSYNESEALDDKGDKNGLKLYSRIGGDEAYAYVNGTVSAVSATAISVSVKHRDENNLDAFVTKVYTFSIDAKTKVIRKFKATASISEVAVGDRVAVWGSDLRDGRARLIWDKSIWWGETEGTLTDLNTTDKTFKVVLTTENKLGQQVTVVTTVKVSDATTYWQNGVAKSFSDLANDQKVKVRGSWNSAGKFFLANKVTIKS